jgi:hypothetical protein
MITAWIGSLLFSLVLILYVLLVLGLPLGEFAMGGKYTVLPAQMRIATAVSALIQLFGILVLLQLGNILPLGLPENIAKGIGYFFGAYLILNTLMNAASKSKKERLVMTPLSAVAAFCFLYTAIAA